MTTALIISELLELHDDTLIADIERAFDEIDASVPIVADGDSALMLIVDELVEEMLAPDRARGESTKLSISLDIYDDDGASSDEVAEVA